uniref:Uncharacterized protein n=1 Tax=Setaria italica TaxID=4555 RepID=K3ZWM2_SETIT
MNVVAVAVVRGDHQSSPPRSPECWLQSLPWCGGAWKAEVKRGERALLCAARLHPRRRPWPWGLREATRARTRRPRPRTSRALASPLETPRAQRGPCTVHARAGRWRRSRRPGLAPPGREGQWTWVPLPHGHTAVTGGLARFLLGQNVSTTARRSLRHQRRRHGPARAHEHPPARTRRPRSSPPTEGCARLSRRHERSAGRLHLHLHRTHAHLLEELQHCTCDDDLAAISIS